MKNKKAFSFVELMVSITILAIISTIWFISYTSYLWDSRDSQRKSDLAQMWSALKVYKQKRWYFPVPWKNFNITFKWEIVANQWLFNTDVRLNTLDNLPLDPKTKWSYFYSITKNAQEYELSASLENTDTPIAILNWTYKSVSKNTLPTIILAINTNQGANIEIDSWTWDWSINRNKFIFSEQSHNMPYNFTTFQAVSDWTTLETLLTEAEGNSKYWQNTDYRSCIEIKESWKNIQTNNQAVEYQIIDENWILINRNCTCNTITCTWD